MAKAVPKPSKPSAITVHAKLAAETVEQLDGIAAANNITRAAAIAIAVSRLIKSGL